MVEDTAREDSQVHEYALTKRMVQVINDTAAANGAAKVNAAYLVIGENTSVIPESLQMYFDMIAKGTPAQGARLHMRLVKAEMHCPHCNKAFPRPRFSFACPTCGTLGNPTDTGNACYVERVELEVAD